MLKPRQIIPPVTMRALHATPQPVGAPLPEGRTVRAWDYKQKRALMIAFLHYDCVECRAWVESLSRNMPALAEREATALLVFANAPDARMLEGLPANIVMGVDVTGRSIAAFLGKQALDRAGQTNVGVFVADRYGELFAQWPAEVEERSPSKNHDALPAIEEVLSWLAHLQLACG